MTYLRLLWPVALALLSFWAGWEWRDRSADLVVAKTATTVARAEATAQADARKAEKAGTERLADIGTEHEKDRRNAQDVPAAVVAELRSGALRLRDELAGCETQRLSDSVAGAIQRDEAARVREEIAGALVQVGREADDQVRAAQQVIEADRK